MSRQHGRKGSLQYWPKNKASRIYPRVNWDGLAEAATEAKPLGFPAFKAGMTHVQYIDTRPGSPSQNKIITKSVTILDAPSLFVCAIRFYKSLPKGLAAAGDRWADAIPKELELERKAKVASKKKPEIKPEEIADVQLLVATQPKKSGMDKRKPDLLELGLGGKAEEKLKLAESLLGKEISVKDVFKSGEFVDVSAITKGYGFEGPVARWGVRIQGRKDKQRQRKPGSIGPTVPRKVDWRVAQSGQYGFFARTEFNKRLLTIGEDPKTVNPAGGLLRYGLVPGTFMLVEGSVPGPTKRLILLRKAFRSHPKETAISLSYVSTASKQGVR